MSFYVAETIVSWFKSLKELLTTEVPETKFDVLFNNRYSIRSTTGALIIPEAQSCKIYDDLSSLIMTNVDGILGLTFKYGDNTIMVTNGSRGND